MMMNSNFEEIAFREFVYQKGVQILNRTILTLIISCAILIFILLFDFEFAQKNWVSIVKLFIYCNTIIISGIIVYYFRRQKKHHLVDGESSKVLQRLQKIFYQLFGIKYNSEELVHQVDSGHHQQIKFNTCLDKNEYFSRNFRKFFFTILLLYIAMFIVELNEPMRNPLFKNCMSVVKFTLNNISAWYIFRCFVELYLPSKKNPEKLRLHLNSFSLAIALSLTLIFIAALIYGDKSIYKSEDIMVVERPDCGSENLVDLDKQINWPEDDIEKEKESKEVSLSLPKNDTEEFKDKGLMNLINRQIYNSDTLNINTHSSSEVVKSQPHFIKSYFEVNPHKRSNISDSLHLAISQKPNVKDTLLKLPEYLYVYHKNQKNHRIKYIHLGIRSDHQNYFKEDILYINSKPLFESEKMLYTDYRVDIISKDLHGGQLIEFPDDIQLYREKEMHIMMGMFDTISGLFNALALALLIGRLDSKLIGLRNFIIAFLFLYAAIQPLFPFLNGSDIASEEVQLLIVFIAFVLKLFLFLVILFVIKTGRLLIYFYCFGELDKRADSIFANQFEIAIQYNDHHKKFAYYVTNDEYRIFNTVKLYDTLDLTKKAIENLQKIIKLTPSKLKLHEGFEKKWFELLDEPHDISIYSLDLEYNKVEEFHEEVLENLPYCKVKILV